jgi:hypothetical protein
MAHTLGHDKGRFLRAAVFIIGHDRHASLSQALFIRLKLYSFVMRRVGGIYAAMALAEIKSQLLLQRIGFQQRIGFAYRSPKLNVRKRRKRRRRHGRRTCRRKNGACERKSNWTTAHERLLG